MMMLSVRASAARGFVRRLLALSLAATTGFNAGCSWYFTFREEPSFLGSFSADENVTRQLVQQKMGAPASSARCADQRVIDVYRLRIETSHVLESLGSGGGGLSAAAVALALEPILTPIMVIASEVRKHAFVYVYDGEGRLACSYDSGKASETPAAEELCTRPVISESSLCPQH